MRSVLLGLLLALAVQPVSAQILRGIGVKAGAAVSTLSFDTPPGQPEFATDPRVGPSAYVFMEWLNVPVFSVVVEAGWMRRGFVGEGPLRDLFGNPLGIVRETYRFDYFSSGLLAKLRLPVGAAQPYVIAGPRVDYLLSRSDQFLFYSDVARGFVAGGGLEVDLPLAPTLMAEVRYSFDTSNSLPETPEDAYGQSLTLLLGFRL
jgi:hypothetical protein